MTQTPPNDVAGLVEAARFLLWQYDRKGPVTDSAEAWEKLRQSLSPAPVAQEGELREARPALPIEAVHRDGCEFTRAPTGLCDCPRPIFAASPVPVDAGGVARDAKAIAAAVVQSACETDPADPEHPDTITIECGDLESIVRMHVECADERASLAHAAPAAGEGECHRHGKPGQYVGMCCVEAEAKRGGIGHADGCVKINCAGCGADFYSRDYSGSALASPEPSHD